MDELHVIKICNRCNQEYTAIGVCPKCRCPEYRLDAIELTPDRQVQAAAGDRQIHSGEPKETIMSKKKVAKKTPARKPAPEKKTPPKEKQESPPKLNDPVGDFTEEELREFRTECANRRRDIRKKAVKMEETKRLAKIAKENCDAATMDLLSYIDGFEELPLFGQEKDNPNWRTTPIEDLDIEEWIAKLLIESNVTTVGMLDEEWEEQGLAVFGEFDGDQLKAIGDALDKVRSEPEKKEKAVWEGEHETDKSNRRNQDEN